MHCIKCGLEMREFTGMFNWESLLVGTVRVPGIKYLQCPKKKCNYKLLDMAAAMAIEAVYKEKEKAAVAQIPVGEFMSTQEAAALLGIAANRMRYTPKIRNGFIISHKIGASTLWLKASVLAFKETGDGRIRVSKYRKRKVSVK